MSSEQVTDMVVAMLNICSEEPMESSDDPDKESVVVLPESPAPHTAERRKIVRGESKTPIVGQMACVFSVLRFVPDVPSSLNLMPMSAGNYLIRAKVPDPCLHSTSSGLISIH